MEFALSCKQNLSGQFLLLSTMPTTNLDNKHHMKRKGERVGAVREGEREREREREREKGNVKQRESIDYEDCVHVCKVSFWKLNK